MEHANLVTACICRCIKAGLSCEARIELSRPSGQFNACFTASPALLHLHIHVGHCSSHTVNPIAVSRHQAGHQTLILPPSPPPPSPLSPLPTFKILETGAEAPWSIQGLPQPMPTLSFLLFWYQAGICASNSGIDSVDYKALIELWFTTLPHSS